MTQYAEQLERIKVKLIEASEVDKSFSVFGASSHCYRLNKPATIDEVEQFENEYSIQLPECYRSFILNIGNGGAGPYYGIFPLGVDIDELLYEFTKEYLKSPCVLYPKLTAEYWKELSDPLEDENISDEMYEQTIGKRFGGVLPIGHQGCTYIHGLVLNSEFKGRVMNLDCDSQIPKFTYENNFLDWYERWLDEVISEELIRNTPSWFGYTMGGSVSKILDTYFSTNDQETKEDCLIGILNKNIVEAETIRKIEELLSENSGELKLLLIQILTKFDYSKAKPHLIVLSKTDLLHTFQFVHEYAKDKSSEFEALIQANKNRIEDVETLRFAIYLLEKSGCDLGKFILPFTENQDMSIRGHAFLTLGNVKHIKRYIDYFIKGLSDKNFWVVEYTLMALRDLKDKRLLIHYKKIAEKFPIEEERIIFFLNQRLRDYGLDNVTIQQIDLDKFIANFKDDRKKWYQFWK